MAATQLELRRSHAFVAALEHGLKIAVRQGGPNAQMHVGDVLDLITAFRSGQLDPSLADSAPVRVGSDET